MRYQELLEMSYSEALGVFQQFGIQADTLPLAALSQIRRTIAQRLHPDKPGADLERMKAINAAFDAIKQEKSSQAEPSRSRDEPSAAGNYSDVNFIKQRMWQLSGGSQNEYIVMNFDGQGFRKSFTVNGSPKIFDEMARAMLIYAREYDRQAIVVSPAGQGLLLIWSNQVFHHPPIPLNIDFRDPRAGRLLGQYLNQRRR